HSDGTDQVVAEIRATDRAGLLALLTAVFERADVDISWAKVTTLGSSVVDAFGIVLAGADEAAVRQNLEAELMAILPTPPPAKPAEQAS
ncbi:MAG: [protein-PII] uridylyltransferase, partial [Mycobacterium sp.]|nr:[protein-PII] uridylyltransferase [Mycobacterium sp.]